MEEKDRGKHMIYDRKSIKVIMLHKLLLLLAMIILGVILFIRGAESMLIISCEAVILLLGAAMQVVFKLYFKAQKEKIDQATQALQNFMQGDLNSRLDSNEEGEMAKFFEEINHMVLSLHSHIEREKHQKEFLKETISDISHQLKTPLAAIRMYNEIMKREKDNEKTIDTFTNKTERSLDRMERLIQNLMKLTKLDAGMIVLEKKEVMVKELVQSVFKEFETRAQLEGKDFTVSGNESVILYCDTNWTAEALSNLIHNAFEHTQAGNTITVSWIESPVMIRILVEDNGEGIYAEDIHHIFKRFYRSRFSTNTQGVGLGLALTKSIVEAHGGSVSVSSKRMYGSSFFMDFIKMTKL